MKHPVFPRPPVSVLESIDAHFEAGPKVAAWTRFTFLDEASPLHNPDHQHLIEADILFLWASYPEKRQGRQIAGTAEKWQPQQKKWATGRTVELIRNFNGGEDPTFIITLSAQYCQHAPPEAICALIDHELYHCGQMRDKDGEPRFVGGQPVYEIRGHDVEEFYGIVERYGAYDGRLKRMQDAFGRPPLIKRSASESVICGCGAAV